jgi:lysophospholipase L1-like esterase
MMVFDEAYKGEIEVFAESRRKMYSRKAGGGARCFAFTVNARDPEGQPIQAVERGRIGLNLRLTKGIQGLKGLHVKTATKPVVLYIAGDSTVADQEPQLNLPEKSRFTGWGQMIPAYFDKGISVANYADSGESTAAFRPDGGSLWARIYTPLKSGDWVFIQLGHNDKTTSAATYRSRIVAMIAAIKEKRAFPVLISPMVRNTNEALDKQHIYGDLNVRKVLMEISASQKVPLIDLMGLSSGWALQQGQSLTQDYFVNNDRTHSNELGADVFAKFIVQEIRKQNIAIHSFLR